MRFDESRVLGNCVRENMELDTSILGSIIPQDLPAEEDDSELLVPSPELSVVADPSNLVPDSTRSPVETVSDTRSSMPTEARSRILASTSIPQASLRRSSHLRPLPAAVIANIQQAECNNPYVI